MMMMMMTIIYSELGAVRAPNNAAAAEVLVSDIVGLQAVGH